MQKKNGQLSNPNLYFWCNVNANVGLLCKSKEYKDNETPLVNLDSCTQMIASFPNHVEFTAHPKCTWMLRTFKYVLILFLLGMGIIVRSCIFFCSAIRQCVNLEMKVCVGGSLSQDASTAQSATHQSCGNWPRLVIEE